MNATSTRLTITDMYMSVLSSLTRDEKLDLIGKLKASLSQIGVVDSSKTITDPFAGFSSDWGEGMSSEEYSEQLRSARSFSRIVETW